MSVRFEHLRRKSHAILILTLLVLAVSYFIPLRTNAFSLASMQEAGRRGGALRGRIQQRMEKKKAEAKEAKERNERPPTETRQMAGLTVAIWKPSQRGRAPLLAFSHGFHGCNTQSSYMMQRFADEGYLVVAPNHRDAGCGGGRGRPEEKFGQAENWDENTYRDRGDNIRNLLTAMRRDSEWTSQVDWSRVGLVGHSLGGYTVLGLAGCWPSWRLSNIKAVLAWSPYCEPYAVKGDLDGIRVPVMYQTGTRDIGIGPTLKKSGGCFSKTASPAILVEFNGAGHFAWTDLQHTAQQLIDEYSVEFVDKYVRGVAGANPAERVSGVFGLESKVSHRFNTLLPITRFSSK